MIKQILLLGFGGKARLRDGNRGIRQHYAPDYSPAHEMRSRSPEAILLGLLRENLIPHMRHIDIWEESWPNRMWPSG